MRASWLLPLLLFLTLLPWSVPVALAQDDIQRSDKADPVLAARDKLDEIRSLAAYEDSLTPGSIEDLLTELEIVRRTADECADKSSAALVRLQRQAQVLDPPQDPSAADSTVADDAPTDAAASWKSISLRDKRAKLSAQRSRLQTRLTSCRLLELESQELGYDLFTIEQELLTRARLVRGPNVVEVIRHNIENGGAAWAETGRQVLRLLSGQQELGWLHSLGLFVTVLLAFLLSTRLRRRPWLQATSDSPQHFTNNLILAIGGVVRAYLAPLLILIAINAYLVVFDLHTVGVPVIAQVARGALLLLLMAISAKALLDPPPPAQPLLAVPAGRGRRLSRLLQTFALLLLIGFVMLLLREAEVIQPSMRLLAADIYVALVAANALLLLLNIGREETGARRHFKRKLPAVAVMTILITAWLGYQELARLLFWGIVGTSLGLLLVLLASRLFDDLQDSLDEGRYGWQRIVRSSVGLGPNDPVPALGWLTLLLKAGLWALLIVLLLQLWGVPNQGLKQVGGLFINGFAVGSVFIAPSRIAGALLTLLLLIMASRWIARQLGHRWLLRTRMEQSAREAVATTVGYVGIAAAILLTLSMAGIDFSNLAIIAGALSVGIGFGLQNVVNNFVSGLIMLVERPVKTGDWIVVGNTEGYVRRISIRTTIIQTFDRADVIVPNSELISNQVTNWMHSNAYGRFRVPVGVAYGSDTEQVHDLMLQVAQDHPQVVRGFPSWPDPTVLFIGFGDSSLNFELRGIIYNIDMRMRVMSDLNFAIDKTFREHGIEIPFPQRVIHHAAPGSGSDEPTDDPKTSDSPN